MPDIEPPLTADERSSAERVETEVIARLERKAWLLKIVGSIGVILLTIIGYFGLKEIVRSVTETEIREAFRAAVVAGEAAKKTTAVTEDATKITEAYGRTVGALQGQAVAVQAQFAELTQRIEGERVNLRLGAEKARTSFDARLNKLEELVAKVVQDTQTNRQAVEAYMRDAEKAKAAAAADAKRFIDNSQYVVSVQFTSATKDLAMKVQDILAKAGFKVAAADLAQAERFATAYATATASTANVSAAPTINSIRFTEKSAPKIQEIRDLLSPVVQFKRAEQFDASTRLPSQMPFTLKSSTWADLNWELGNIPRIVIYLVEKP